MYAKDADALYCDMAETYGIFDWQALPAQRLAVLACGLSPDSRVRRAMAGIREVPEIILLAAAVDNLRLLVWSKTRDAEHGRNRPASIVAQLLDREAETDESEIMGFDSPEEFEAYMAGR